MATVWGGPSARRPPAFTAGRLLGAQVEKGEDCVDPGSTLRIEEGEGERVVRGGRVHHPNKTTQQRLTQGLRCLLLSALLLPYLR